MASEVAARAGDVLYQGGTSQVGTLANSVSDVRTSSLVVIPARVQPGLGLVRLSGARLRYHPVSGRRGNVVMRPRPPATIALHERLARELAGASPAVAVWLRGAVALTKVAGA